MPLFTRKTAVLAKIETVNGTDSVPTGGANAMVIRNVTLTPQDLDVVDRDLVRPYMGNSPQLVVGQKVQLEFEIEMAGAGTSAITKAKWDALMRACGFASVTNSTISNDYTPISAAFESLSAYTFIDGIKHGMVGAMGDVEFNITAKGMPVLKFKFLGIYQTPADTANPSLTTTGWQVPLGVNNQNTTGFSLHSFAGVMASLSIKMNNVLSYQNLVGAEFVQITDRKASGSVSIQAPLLTTKDFFAASKNMTLAGLACIQGTAAFNKVQFASSNCQVMRPNYGDMEGIRMLNMDLNLVPSSAGNDEITVSTL